jgi:hypothetical protein
MGVETQIGGDGLLFVGEDKVFICGPITDKSGALVNISGWTILFVVRKKDATPDPAMISQTASVTGSFNTDPLLNTQVASVTVADTDMDLFKAGTYRYSWKRMDAGAEVILAYGDFVVQRATAA